MVYRIIQYLKYRLQAKDEHSIHSPFLFELYCSAFLSSGSYYIFNDFNLLRQRLLNKKREFVEVNDLGAGSQKLRTSTRTVAQIAKYSVKQKKYAELLFKLVNRFKPKTIIELGTSLGLTTMHLAYPQKNAKVHTIEGCENIATIAQQHFSDYHFENIDSITGNFDSCLPNLLSTISTVDFMFFDGNHQKEATINYFLLCLEKANEDSVFVFDDIYWSKGMTEAWKYIKSHPKVTQTIDIYQLGIVFFRQSLTKEDFVLRY